MSVILLIHYIFAGQNLPYEYFTFLRIDAMRESAAFSPNHTFALLRHRLKITTRYAIDWDRRGLPPAPIHKPRAIGPLPRRRVQTGLIVLHL